MPDLAGIITAIQALSCRDVIFLLLGLVWGILFGRVNKKITEWVHDVVVKLKGLL